MGLARAISHFCWGSLYSIGGGIAGIVSGISIGTALVGIKNFLKLPNSGINVTNSFDASHFSEADFFKCLNEQKPDCHIPVETNVNLSNITHPIAMASVIGAGVGVLVGGVFYAYRANKANQNAQRGTYDEEAHDTLLGGEHSVQERSIKRGCW